MLVLSIFPGLGLLDRAFESEGFCVVRGPDVIWGGDVRGFHPPAGVFDGVMGGDPCQSHSALANLVRAKGFEPSFPDLTPEFERVVNEVQPAWFLRENVPAAPEAKPAGYGVHSFLLDNAWLDSGDGMGEQQTRKRRFWFGRQGQVPYDLRKHLEYAALELREKTVSVTGAHSLAFHNPGAPGRLARYRRHSVTGAHTCSRRPKGGHGEQYTLPEMLELQGLPEDFLDHCPFTVQGKRKAIGNGVTQAMGRALARAICAAVRES